MLTRLKKMLGFLRKQFSDSESHQALSLESYVRCYGDNAHQFGGMVVSDLEPHHCRFSSSLHRGAPSLEPDVSAFLYSALRLPDCVSRVNRVLIGPTEEVFASAGFPHVDTWTRVESRARRRRHHHDGSRTLAVFVTSITDLDDLVPSLCAFQIEWNKMHKLLSRNPLAKGLAEGKVKASHVGADIRHCLGLGRNDWELLVQVWRDDWDKKFAQLAGAPLCLTIDRLPLHTRDFEAAAGLWWDRVIRHLALDSPRNRSIYIVSSNTHGLANLVSGYATAHQGELLDFLQNQNPEGLWQTWLDSSKDPDQNPNDLLYYAMRQYLDHNPHAVAAKTRWEESTGLIRYSPAQYPNLEAQKIELNCLDPSHLDSRLKWREALTRSRAMIINMDYPLGLAAGHLLSQACRRFSGLSGVFILGKSAATIGRIGDIMIPSLVHDSHTGNRYRFRNSLSIRRLTPFLNRIAAFDDQKSITVRGTFLHGRDTISHLTRDDFTGIEMEAGPYLNALYRHFTGQAPPRNKTLDMDMPPGFSLGLLHYTSDTPYNVRPSLLCSRLGLTGLEAAYASSLAILQRIMDLEASRLKSAGTTLTSPNGCYDT